jgi:hypothetical protein
MKLFSICPRDISPSKKRRVLSNNIARFGRYCMGILVTTGYFYVGLTSFGNVLLLKNKDGTFGTEQRYGGRKNKY